MKRKIKLTNNLISYLFKALHIDTDTKDLGGFPEWFLLHLAQWCLKAVSPSGENCHLVDFLGVMTIYILRICITLRICLYYLKQIHFELLRRKTVMQEHYNPSCLPYASKTKENAYNKTSILIMLLLPLHYYSFKIIIEISMQNRKFGNGKAVGTYSGAILEHHLRSAVTWGSCCWRVCSAAQCAALQRGLGLLCIDRTHGKC